MGHTNMRFKGYIMAIGFLLVVAFTVLNVLAYNLVGDGLRDAIDPRLKV